MQEEYDISIYSMPKSFFIYKLFYIIYESQVLRSQHYKKKNPITIIELGTIS